MFYKTHSNEAISKSFRLYINETASFLAVTQGLKRLCERSEAISKSKETASSYLLAVTRLDTFPLLLSRSENTRRDERELIYIITELY